MIDEIRARFKGRDYEYSLHAVDQSLLRRITAHEVEEAVAAGEVIEVYPGDKYGPSCLIFGRTLAGRPLHIQCTYPSRVVLKIITIYEPDETKWIEFRRRREI
ncbi:MAG: DUF4258 domain-containing protein [Bryobacteraceae bacterium]